MAISKDRLLARIAEEEARVAILGEQQRKARELLESLRKQLGTSCPAPASPPSALAIGVAPATTTPAEKVALFRSLFRGREDVFPTRFVSKRTGKPGYAPACGNKFAPGICELPKVKCGECWNQAFLPFNDQAVLDHLQGRHIMGVYPLLQDETCRFLAADFDKAEWQHDAAAFEETYRSVGVPVALERSRSGNGAHAWIFFAAPVPANVARKMGCYLITETMTRRHQLAMESYDRLFPNQDTMPRGGFGNLIALPLQHDARKLGCTVFLDSNLQPYSDQWAYLASVARLEPAMVEAIAREATHRGQITGVRVAEPMDEGESAPWTLPPTGRRGRTPVIGPLPKTLGAVFAQRLYSDKTGVPAALLNQIKRLAAFQNPEFFKRQSMRLSTAATPRVIACAEDFPQHIALPRGCLGDLQTLLTDNSVKLAVDDQRHEGDTVNLEFHGELTPVQERAGRALLRHDTGICVAPPGIGKTVLGTWLVGKRGRSTLVLVHRKPLLDQWIAQLSMFLDIPEKDVGQIGGGKRKANGRLDVAMIQSMVRKGQVDDIVATYGHVIVDECHHVPAVSFERVLSEVKARYVVGLTATPQRRRPSSNPSDATRSRALLRGSQEPGRSAPLRAHADCARDRIPGG